MTKLSVVTNILQPQGGGRTLRSASAPPLSRGLVPTRNAAQNPTRSLSHTSMRCPADRRRCSPAERAAAA